MGQGYPWPVGSPLESPVSGEETPWGDKIKKKKKQKTIDKVGIARLNKSVFFFFFYLLRDCLSFTQSTTQH